MAFSRYFFITLTAIPAVLQAEILTVSQGQEVEISGNHTYERAVIQGNLKLTGDTQLILTGPPDELGRVFFLDQFSDIRQDFGYGRNGEDGTAGAVGAGGRDGNDVWRDDLGGQCDVCIEILGQVTCNQGVDGEDGTAGENGFSDAEEGEAGRNGYTLAIIAHGDVDIRGEVDLSGQWAGNGGRGGAGGTGGGGGLGQTACLVGGNGGSGARGGQGGPGADGGIGGRGGVFRLTCYADVNLGGSIIAVGGRGGEGGNGGAGGAGGSGADGGHVGSDQSPGAGGFGGDAGIPGQAGRGGVGSRGGIIEIRAAGEIVSSTRNPSSRLLQVDGGKGGDGGFAGGGSPGGNAGSGGIVGESAGETWETDGPCGSPGVRSTGVNMSGLAGRGGDGGQVFLYAEGRIGQLTGLSGHIEAQSNGGEGGIGGGQFRENSDGVCAWYTCDDCAGFTPPTGNTGLQGGDGGNGGYVIAESRVEIRMLSNAEGGEGGRGGVGANCGFGWAPHPTSLVIQNRLQTHGMGGDGGLGGIGGNGGSVRYRAPVLDINDLFGGDGVRVGGGEAGRAGIGGTCGSEYEFDGDPGIEGLPGLDGRMELLGEVPEKLDATLLRAHLLGQLNLNDGHEIDVDTNDDGILDVADFVRLMNEDGSK